MRARARFIRNVVMTVAFILFAAGLLGLVIVAAICSIIDRL